MIEGGVKIKPPTLLESGTNHIFEAPNNMFLKKNAPKKPHKARKLSILQDLRLMPITFSKRKMTKKALEKTLPPFEKNAV